MTSQLPADLAWLHAHILDCEAKGQDYLAAALRIMLNRQIAEREWQNRPMPTGVAGSIFRMFAPRQP